MGNPTIDDPVFRRTSIRKFTDEAVSDGDLEMLMRAAMAAPSAGNQQPWEFVVTRDRDVMRRLSECTPYSKPAAGASMVIVACTRTGDGLRFPPYVAQDMGACIENILVEAAALGLGAVWLGIAPEKDRIASVAECIDIPEGLEAFALVAVGHPDEAFEPRGVRRYEPERVHIV